MDIGLCITYQQQPSTLMITQLKEDQFWIKYNTNIPGNKWYIIVFTDASLKGLPGAIESAFGFIIFISGGFQPGENKKACPITWKSGKLRRIVTSTYEAEAMALTEAAEEGLSIKRQLVAITSIPADLIEVEAFCDNHDVVS